jgi:hypothetical protein
MVPPVHAGGFFIAIAVEAESPPVVKGGDP